MISEGENNPVIVFDGICNFCNGSVNFIIQRDAAATFRFTPVQSEYAQQLMAKYGLSGVGVDTFLLIKNEKSYTTTDAALEICRDLDGYWPLMRVFRFIPRGVRDFFYRLLARNRYAWFGKAEVCMMPTPEIRARFIGI
ncbi:MAG: thiol-disulfide oxidoreductase DCC family protein [Thiolinea sp.]